MARRRVGRVVLLSGVFVALPIAVVAAAGVVDAGPASLVGSPGSGGRDVTTPDGRLEGLDFDGL
ncbi:MAG TPA: hypothetical protein VGL32_05845, partial [Acidimicrobiales bacterium]